MSIIKAACIQLNNGPDIAENIAVTSEMIREAAGQGAQFIATPENTCHMVWPFTKRLSAARPQENHETLAALQALAAELNIWLSIGSLGIAVDKRTLANRSFLISDQGQIVASYDKIHLFDVDLPNGERYRESAIIRPGEKAVLADAAGAKLGLSICYDVRFATLYRTLAKAGAQILTVPAAFSVPTGQAHWETLLRARAIETGSFVLAPAQTGTHEGGRATWGHSLIIGPWGDILGAAGKEPGIISADLDLDEVEKARTSIPALQHDREFTLEHVKD
ncbi:MAG: carbon-nitrogen hydrolase family protein [Alphaproteobacteria bacterium]|nr:carbon-nitrogen hydrolase family protein [Alphaproteobacteria bacterium]